MDTVREHVERSAATRDPAERPMLVFFGRARGGQSRRTEAFLAQVLQRRRNHTTFALRYVDVDRRPDLAARFQVDQTPALVIVKQRRVVGMLATPRGSTEIAAFLEPWLR